MILPLSACLIGILGLGVAERLARDRAIRAVPIRIHVNGTRGKSTVTRLIWSALREAGIPAIGKTTGTAARLLLGDGSERPVVRRAAPSVREQLAVMRLARRSGARAAVIECMALAPELQWISERDMVRATIGVITNVRRDHTEIMGDTLDEIAATLGNTIPRSGILVTGEDRFLDAFRRRSARLQTRVVSATRAAHDLAASESAPAWLAADLAVALTVTRELGIPDPVARRGFALAPPDPGTVREGRVQVNGSLLRWLDATAANDPESLRALADPAPAQSGGRGPDIFVYNHRADRGARLACFARDSEILAGADHVIVTGARPPWTVVRALRGARGARDTRYVPRRRLPACLQGQPPGTRVVFCGNTRGIDVAEILAEIEAHG